MEITDIRVRRMSKEGKMKAVVSITIDDEFVVHDIKIIEGEKGLFMAMPSRRTLDGEYRDIAHPINSATRERLQNMILDSYENTQPDAQALYRFLREKFPEVTSYAGMEGIGPMGFSPVPMSLFCKGGTQDLSDAVVTRIYTDCEAGYFPNSVTEEEREYILQMLRTAMVTGKANNVFVTGGTNIFVFSDADGRQRFSFELYQGLLVCNDGMYTLSVPEDAP